MGDPVVSTRVPEEDVEALDALAARLGFSRGGALRFIVQNAIGKEGVSTALEEMVRQARDEFEEELLGASIRAREAMAAIFGELPDRG